MQITYREMDIRLRVNGWYETRCKGSHHQYRHPVSGRVVTVPGRRSAEVLSRNVVNNIEKAMNLAA